MDQIELDEEDDCKSDVTGTTSGKRCADMSKASSSDDKRLRREIANSNERRRMQSINAGFVSLRQLLPLNEGEKLSKAAILQLTSKYINVLLQEKSRLLQHNNKLKELLQQQSTPPCFGRSGDESVQSELPSKTPLQSQAQPQPEPQQQPVAIAQEVTVSDVPSAKPFPLEPAQMSLPFRKRKRTFSLCLEPASSKTPLVRESPATDNNDTDADAGANASRTPARPRDVPTSSAASDADSVAMATERYRFVPSAACDAKGDDCSASYGNLLVSGAAQATPVRFDVLQSGLLLATQDCRPASPCEPSGSITKRNLETIFEAIRHVEGDDLSLGETPASQACNNRMREKQAVLNAPASMLLPLGDSQPQTAFLVCLSPANLLSPASGQAEFVQNASMAPYMGTVNTVLSPVSVGVNGSSRYVPSRGPLLVNMPSVGEYDYTRGTIAQASAANRLV